MARRTLDPRKWRITLCLTEDENTAVKSYADQHGVAELAVAVRMLVTDALVAHRLDRKETTRE